MNTAVRFGVDCINGDLFSNELPQHQCIDIRCSPVKYEWELGIDHPDNTP